MKMGMKLILVVMLLVIPSCNQDNINGTIPPIQMGRRKRLCREPLLSVKRL